MKITGADECAAFAMSAIDDALELAWAGAEDVFVSGLGARDVHAKDPATCKDDQRRNPAQKEFLQNSQLTKTDSGG